MDSFARRPLNASTYDITAGSRSPADLSRAFATAPDKLLAPEKKKKERLGCLDAVRGLNVMLMILVDNIGGHYQAWVDHSPWDVVHLADFVMPLFLFMVGVSMAFSMRKYGGPGLKYKIMSRTVKLFVIGCLTQGCNGFIWLPYAGDTGLQHLGIDLANMRIPGILQRIAFAYFVVAMMKLLLPVYTVRGFVMHGQWEDAPRHPLAIFTHYALHWLVALLFFLLYLGIMLFAFVPTWSWTDPSSGMWSESDCVTNSTDGAKTKICNYTWIPERVYTTKCDTRGDLTPACSATRLVDAWLLGWSHMYASGEYARSHWCSSCSPHGDFTQCEPVSWGGHGPPPHEEENAANAVVVASSAGSGVGCEKDNTCWCHAQLDPEGALSSLPTGAPQCNER